MEQAGVFPVSMSKCLLGEVYPAHRQCQLWAEAKMQKVGKEKEQFGHPGP